MAGSQLVTTAEASNGTVTVTTKDATLTDMVTTLVSSNQAVTGVYGFGQKALLVAAGMAIHSYRKSGSLNFAA